MDIIKGNIILAIQRSDFYQAIYAEFLKLNTHVLTVIDCQEVLSFVATNQALGIVIDSDMVISSGIDLEVIKNALIDVPRLVIVYKGNIDFYRRMYNPPLHECIFTPLISQKVAEFSLKIIKKKES